jgi:S1-C subfamily serine protease
MSSGESAMNSLATKLHKSLIIAVTLLLTAIAASALDFTKIARANYGNVYRVVAFNEDNETESIGTGFYMSPNVLLTNYHVIREAGRIGIFSVDGKLVSEARVVKASAKMDVAFLGTERTNNTFIRLGDSNELSTGEGLMMLGFPNDKPLRTEGTAQAWVVPGVVFSYTAAIDHGNSGGPVFNAYGQAIGMATFALRNGQAGAIGGRAILEVLGVIPKRLIIGVDVRSDEDVAYDAVHGVFK